MLAGVWKKGIKVLSIPVLSLSIKPFKLFATLGLGTDLPKASITSTSCKGLVKVLTSAACLACSIISGWAFILSVISWDLLAIAA